LIFSNTNKVSIVIPVYKNTNFVKECINSALNQTYPNIEVIAVVEDGTDFAALKIVESYSDRIKIVRKKHGNQPSAWNAGIKEMTGEWFKWLADDDVLYPNCIEELIKDAKKLPDKKGWILSFDHDDIDIESKVLWRAMYPNYSDMRTFDYNVILLHHNIIHADTVLIHKSTLQDYGMFDEGFGNLVPDYEMWLRYCLVHNVRVRYVRKNLTSTRIHEDRITQKTSKKEWRKVEKKVRKYVLEKLDSTKRQQYESALRRYRIKFFFLRPKNVLNSFILWFFPLSTATKVSNVYRRITHQKLSNWSMER